MPLKLLLTEEIMSFLTELKKSEKKLVESGIAVKAPPPKWWISTGNFLLNKIISGKYLNGIGQGRLSLVTGPSSAGKSFIIANLAREAQKIGCGIFAVDSENALDDEFMSKIGVDTERPDYIYRGVSTIPQAQKMIQGFIKAYRDHKEEQKFLLIVDSLDMLRTSSQAEHYEKGETKGDQGQHAKQTKDMLAPWVNDIRDLNIAIVCSKQVFQEQDPMLQKNPQTAWKLTEAVKYAFSQILLVTKFMLKDESPKKGAAKVKDTQYAGIRLKAYGLKTRFTKPFQVASILVPYETGIDPYDGIFDVAVSMGVIGSSPGSAWYTYKDKKFQKSAFSEIQEEVLAELIAQEDAILEDIYEGEIIEASEADNKRHNAKKRNAKLEQLSDTDEPTGEEDSEESDD